ncbi:SOS response-associated peptidase [Halocatena pleomorpha]|uniref:SOS response-associated peptidase n=1 Tax=Halocatena pleomorpha TaxID=1785090 RepID=A0A3P3RBP1_9EURY|nr:SOS response-associated peptidase [Halocatena pleomorpha]RRJ30368.1 SOS response-associated peptidase [Halocatena pleomorpha]
MCGRYSLFVDPETIEERFGARVAFDFEPRYNAAPGQQLPIVRDDTRTSVTRAQWGLVPSWADEPSTELINARSETVTQTQAFQDAYWNRRCLVPIDGFYEWVDTNDGQKQPHRITSTDDRPFALAGLWETWNPPNSQAALGDFSNGGDGVDASEPLVSFTVLTREPNDTVSEYHDRMPVILSEREETGWLDGVGIDALDPTPEDALRGYPVSSAVNNPSNDSPVVVEPIELSGS